MRQAWNFQILCQTIIIQPYSTTWSKYLDRYKSTVFLHKVSSNCIPSTGSTSATLPTIMTTEESDAGFQCGSVINSYTFSILK